MFDNNSYLLSISLLLNLYNTGINKLLPKSNGLIVRFGNFNLIELKVEKFCSY